eukprot:CAMPEP_0117582286 /NCGR_PEP_ID=MMETSP0784-20121206/66345_1 /TAXON_ID=39447 /ORGANISM="" /LENGTH=483 /DNA_ID=CAMNT_0005382785 /DNA_START=26 /DNA_END=1477 /DNA_ORIENTATION=-
MAADPMVSTVSVCVTAGLSGEALCDVAATHSWTWGEVKQVVELLVGIPTREQRLLFDCAPLCDFERVDASIAGSSGRATVSLVRLASAEWLDADAGGRFATVLRERGFSVSGSLSKNCLVVRRAASSAAVATSRPREDEACIARIVLTGPLDACARAAVLRECAQLRRIAPHPNLIPLHGIFVDDGFCTVLTSFADGGDLRRVIAGVRAAEESIPEPAVLWVLRQVLAGLAHLHGQGALHRDLRSSKIYLCEGNTRVRIGACKPDIQSQAEAGMAVESDDFLERFAYLAPELMMNEAYERHADMWAIGTICFQLCSLRLPFLGRSLLDQAMLVMDAQPDWALMASRSPQLRAVTCRLLSKDAQERPTAVGLLQDELFVEAAADPCRPFGGTAPLWNVEPLAPRPTAPAAFVPGPEGSMHAGVSTDREQLRPPMRPSVSVRSRHLLTHLMGEAGKELDITSPSGGSKRGAPSRAAQRMVLETVM